MRASASAPKAVRTSKPQPVDPANDDALHLLDAKASGKIIEFPEIDEDDTLPDWVPSYYSEWRPL